MEVKVLYFIFWVLVTSSVCFSWNSNLNSVFSSKSISNAMSSKILQAVSEGLSMAITHCNREFRWNRWNCPDTAFSRRSKRALTKEIAYSTAILSASIVHRISRTCSEENNRFCDCNVNGLSEAVRQEMKRMEHIPPPKMNRSSFTSSESSYQIFKRKFPIFERLNEKTQVEWRWGGCSDDPGFGEQEAIKLLAEDEKESDVQGLIEKHNNRIGRQMVKETMVRKCRCHGVSGSCSHQTCWLQVAPFAEIAHALKERYKRAIRISFEETRGARTIGNSVGLHLNPTLRLSGYKQLVYLDESPDYCIPDISTGWPGTIGRMCSKSNSTDQEERKSCRRLCRRCGHKVKRERKKVGIRCNCTFEWCCEVKCETCFEMVDHFSCV